MKKDNLQTGIWLIGIGILALTNFWWPGIMFVIGLSVLMSGSIQWAIWPIGIGVIALFDFWWPGMLFLVGITIIVNAILPESMKSSEDDDEAQDAPLPDPSASSEPSYASPTPPAPTPPNTPPPAPTVPRAWLPTRCPACGAPLTPTEAIWLDDTHAECPYCHTQLTPK